MIASLVGRFLGGTLDPPVTEQADKVERVWHLFLYIGYGVYGLVIALTFWIVIRYRRRNDRLPRQKHYNIPIELTYLVLPLLLVCGLFVVTFVTVRNIDGTTDDPDLVVHVTAYQWSWQFDYPESGVTVVDDHDNEVPELVLPASSTVRFELESADVVHSFWLTPFRFKRDVIPGTPTTFRVDMDDTTGEFPNAGVCAEYCGLDHAKMRFSLRILAPDDFQAWIDQQRAQQGGRS